MPGEEEIKKEEGEVEPEVEDDGSIILSKEAYETLLSEIAASKGASEKVLERVEKEDAEIEKGKRVEAERGKATRYNSVKTADEFAAVLKDDIMRDVMEQAIQPVANTVMSLVVAAELKDVERKYPEAREGEESENIPFSKVKDQVYKIVTENTKLSLEDGYLIATGKMAKPKAEKKVDMGPSGERPGGPTRKEVEPTGKMSSKAAATAAYEKIFGGKK